MRNVHRRMPGRGDLGRRYLCDRSVEMHRLRHLRKRMPQRSDRSRGITRFCGTSDSPCINRCGANFFFDTPLNRRETCYGPIPATQSRRRPTTGEDSLCDKSDSDPVRGAILPTTPGWRLRPQHAVAAVCYPTVRTFDLSPHASPGSGEARLQMLSFRSASAHKRDKPTNRIPTN